jgi:quercetin dioxygenase-like cupin family protein
VSEALFIPPGSGEIIADTPERRVEVLSDIDPLHATTTRFGPRRNGADLHVHRLHTDFFYVLGGELTVRLGPDDRPVTVAPGTLARVPPNVVHGFRNAADGDLRFLNFHAPGQQFVDYLRALRERQRFSYDQYDPPEDGGRSPEDAAIGEELFVADRPGLRLALLTDVEEIGISESWAEPGGPSPPPHCHQRHVESFYVLSGEMAFSTGDDELHAPAGTWVQMPPGVPHSFSFPGTEGTRFLDVHSPSCGFGDFVRGLHDAQTDEDLAVVRAAFDQVAA